MIYIVIALINLICVYLYIDEDDKNFNSFLCQAALFATFISMIFFIIEVIRRFL